MSALKLWRTEYKIERDAGLPTRPSSPSSEDDEGFKSGDDELDEMSAGARAELRKPPTSSSWVQWWSRSRRDNASKIKAIDRPTLKESSSVPLVDNIPNVCTLVPFFISH